MSTKILNQIGWPHHGLVLSVIQERLDQDKFIHKLVECRKFHLLWRCLLALLEICDTVDVVCIVLVSVFADLFYGSNKSWKLLFDKSHAGWV